MSNRIVSFSGPGETTSVRLPPGRYTIDLQCGGSTVSIQSRSYSVLGRSFKDATLPDDTTSTSTDQNLELAGGLEYRLNVTSYVGAGSFCISGVEK